MLKLLIKKCCKYGQNHLNPSKYVYLIEAFIALWLLRNSDRIKILFNRYVYKRLRFLGIKQVSQAAALSFLAIWHGIHEGYFTTFAYEFLTMNAEKQVSDLNWFCFVYSNVLVYRSWKFFSYTSSLFFVLFNISMTILVSYFVSFAFKN